MVVIDEGSNESPRVIYRTKTIYKDLGEGWKYQLGDKVQKTKGSEWVGIVVGFYVTPLTPYGYCVASSYHKNTVQIYPENALEKI